MNTIGGWQQVLRTVRDTVGRSAYEAWFANLDGRVEGRRLVVSCPDRFSRDWIQDRYGDALARAAGDYESVEFETGSPTRPVSKSPGTVRFRGKSVDSAPRWNHRSELRFDTFVAGPSNALALEAARSVARGDVGRCNPLVLAGETGAGKTHLCRSIAAELEAPVVYRSSEEFTSEVTSGIRSGQMERIRHRYRRAHNVLILEDVHFLQGKKATQLELFHTLEHLMQEGKSVVLSVDRAPHELDLDPKLVSRLGSGLIARIGHADRATQLAILRERAAAGGVRVSEACLDQLVDRRVRNVRDLISGLNQVVARASLLKRPITPELVREALADVDVPGAPRTLGEIIEVTAAAYGLKPADLRGRSRRRQIVRPRHFAMYLCRRYTDASLKDIGAALNRDHTSVMHAIQSVERKTVEQPQVRYEFEALAARFGPPRDREGP